MKNNHPVVLIGMGGHARVLLEALRCSESSVLGYVNPAPVSLPDDSIQYLGNDEHFLSNSSPEDIRLVNGVGGVEVNVNRKEVFKRYKSIGYRFATVIHPSSVIARDVALREGSQVMAGVVIQPGSFIDSDAIINTRASIDHDCRIGKHVHLASGVTLSGHVCVGDGTHVGTGATVIQGIRIGAGSLISAGAVVICSFADNVKVAGVPACEMK